MTSRTLDVCRHTESSQGGTEAQLHSEILLLLPAECLTSLSSFSFTRLSKRSIQGGVLASIVLLGHGRIPRYIQLDGWRLAVPPSSMVTFQLRATCSHHPFDPIMQARCLLTSRLRKPHLRRPWSLRAWRFGESTGMISSPSGSRSSPNRRRSCKLCGRISDLLIPSLSGTR